MSALPARLSGAHHDGDLLGRALGERRTRGGDLLHASLGVPASPEAPRGVGGGGDAVATSECGDADGRDQRELPAHD